MRLLVSAGLLGALLLASPSSVEAQDDEIGYTSDGWGLFGGHLGATVGSALGSALMIASLEVDGAGHHGLGYLATAGYMLLTFGGLGLGAWAFDEGSSHYHWSRRDGWGAMGAYQGSISGFVLGIGSTALLAPDSSPEMRLMIGSVSSVVMLATSFFAFRAMSDHRGHTGWQLLGWWGGTVLGGMSSLIATADLTDRNLAGGMVALSVGLGGVIGAVVAHLAALTLPGRLHVEGGALRF